MFFSPLGYSFLNYWPEPLKKAAAKKIANDFVASRRSSEFADGLKGMSSLYNEQMGPEGTGRPAGISAQNVPLVTVTVTVTVFLYY